MRPWERSLGFRYRPWAIFPLFLCLNTFLSFSQQAPGTKAWVVLGIAALLCLVSLSRQRLPDPGSSLPTRESDLPLAVWPWLLLLGLALFLRSWFVFFREHWTEWDNLFIGMNALQWAEGWDGPLFTTFAQTSTLLPRLSALLVPFSQDPFFILYFPPALFSALALPLAGWAWGRSFGRGFAWVCVGLLGSHYWALLPTWVNLFASPFLAWQCWVFCLLIGCLQAPNDRKWPWALGLGGLTGSGYWTIPAWPATFLFVLVCLLARVRSPQERRALLPPFLGGLFLTLLPFLWTLARGDYGQHVMQMGFWTDPFGIEWILSLKGYLSVLLWGTGAGICLPEGGGFLNPLAGAFFLLGVLELFRSRSDPRVAALAIGTLIFLLPGLLSKDVETFRIHSLLPWMVTLTGIGLFRLARDFPGRSRGRFLFLAVLVCGTLDLVRFPGFLLSFQQPSSSLWRTPTLQAYRILRAKAEKEGPGLVLTDMVPGEVSHSLAFFSRPFNAATDQRLSPKEASWGALFVRRYYGPHLRSRFPGIQWIDLPDRDPSLPGRNGLAILHLTDQDRGTLEEWARYHRFHRSIQLEVMNLPNGASQEGILRRLREGYPDIPKDPFARSLFFETLLFLYSAQRTFHPEDGSTDWGTYGEVLKASFEGSFRNEFLLQKYGRLLASEGDLAGAKRAFREALRLRPSDPWLLHQLRELEGPTARP